MNLERRLQQSGWRVLAWVIIATIGAVFSWAARHQMNPDGITYLDIADAYLRGDWSMALNRICGPLYPLLLAMTLWTLRPGPSYEFAAVHLLNFVIFLGALASFEFFLSRFICYHRNVAAIASSRGRLTLPEWSLRVLGYALFAYSSLNLITVSLVTPDMCFAAFVYLASGLLLDIRLRPRRWLSYPMMGVVLGLGYLAKAPMFLLAFVFLGIAATTSCSHFSLLGVLRRVLAGFIPFALITGSVVVAFFLTGRGLTLGESGKLNYAWHVNGLPYVHWHGEFPGSGRPVHPTRKIFPAPPVYEFATPIGGTYPPMYDPAYWYEGVKVHFDARGHLHNLARSAKILLGMLLRSQVSLMMSGLLLLYLGRAWRLFLQDARPYSILLIPALAAFGVFSLVLFQLRFVGPFVTLFWLCLFAPMTFVESREVERMIKGVTIAMIAMLILPTFSTESDDGVQVIVPQQDSHPQLTVAQGLRQLGVRPGDEVAVIGFSPGSFWARLSRVHIVAEIVSCQHEGMCAKGQPDGVSGFLQASREIRDRVLEAFKTAGAKAVVIKNESHTPLQGWRRIADTDYYVYLLKT